VFVLFFARTSFFTFVRSFLSFLFDKTGRSLHTGGVPPQAFLRSDSIPPVFRHWLGLRVTTSGAFFSPLLHRVCGSSFPGMSLSLLCLVSVASDAGHDGFFGFVRGLLFRSTCVNLLFLDDLPP